MAAVFPSDLLAKTLYLMADTRPRGIRNNNPLNIVISSQPWRGKLPRSADTRFEQFSNIFLGIRAAFVCVRTYINKHRCDTPRKIIARWAPEPDANDVVAYVHNACNKACLSPDERIKFSDKNKICRLIWGMSFVENGQDLPFHYFERAYAMV